MMSDRGRSRDVYFVRGGDWFSDTWEDTGTDFEFRDTFPRHDIPPTEAGMR